LARSGLYLSLNTEMTENNDELTGIVKTPVSVAIPFAAHINVPYVNFLYIGAGVTLNIPVHSWSISDVSVGDSKMSFGKKGNFYIAVPIDLGLDMVKKDKGNGQRFILRFAPEFHDEGIFLPMGFMWQFFNFKIFSKKTWE